MRVKHFFGKGQRSVEPFLDHLEIFDELFVGQWILV